MEKTWTDYVHLHSNLPGARDAFEQDCKKLFQKMHPGRPVHVVRANPGDGGIDVFVGEFSAEPLIVYQCKFFLEGFGDSQKEQIRESFRSISKSNIFSVSQWVLCVPTDDLDLKEHKWWSEWKVGQQQTTSIPINLLNGKDLIMLFKEHGLYELVFDLKDSLRLARIEQLLLGNSIEDKRLENANSPDTLSYNQQQFNILFTPEYTLPYELFYVVRPDDETFQRYLASPKNIWLHGLSGVGKTCLANRNLQLNKLQHIYCYLTALPNPLDASTILLHITEDISDRYPAKLVNYSCKSSNQIKILAQLLAYLFPIGDFIICIDEISIRDQSVFGDFVNNIAAVCAEYRHCKEGNGSLKFIIATIQPPIDFHYNTSKFNEMFTFMELHAWQSVEIDKLLTNMNTVGHLLSAQDIVMVRQACDSPRIAKDIVHQYVLNYQHQALDKVVSYLTSSK
ncbi:hypothetical protein [Hymenobacter lucidus]|uniref:ATP-binding protein n=1 Tax=Hymenobacter lucidus TaxID=2880930 RepID=A0ABS8AZ88_9BACT|nr:hypothetical protein [Hymenobacter lucidus]MCB2411124.1 hypothetical protein [Hymenobacter lucidus]